MSAPTTYATIDMDAPGIPMSRLVKVELRKLVDTRAGFWLVVSMLIIAALITTAMLIWAPDDQLTFASLFAMMNIPTGILLPVLAILLVTSEWSQRTGLVTFTIEPKRSLVVTAKLIVSLIAGVAAVVAALALGAIGNILAGVFHGGAGAWDMTWTGVGHSVLLQMMYLVQGFGFGMLIMSSAAAIVLFFALPTVWSIVASIVPWLRDNIQPWADLGMAQLPFQSGEAVTSDEWLKLAVSAAIWILLPLVLGTWRLLRSEVK